MSQAIPASTPIFRGKLVRTMLGVLVPLSIIPLILLAGLTYFQARRAVTTQFNETLISVENKQIDEIAAWFLATEEGINNIPIHIAFEDAVIAATKTQGTTDPNFAPARATILASLNMVNQTRRLFNQFLIISPAGTILVASQSSQQGQSLAETGYYTQIPQEGLLALFAPEPISDNLTLITTKPIYDEEGTLVATIWGISESNLIENLFTDINFLNTRNYFITSDQTFVEVVQDGTGAFTPNAEQTDLFANQSQSPSPEIVEYRSHDDQTVLAIYTPLDKIKAGLVTEIPTSTMISQMTALVTIFIVFLAVTILLNLFFVWQGSRRIVSPVLDLAISAQHFAEGDWQKRAQVKSSDELGLLAYSFNQMADELSSLYRSLESQVITRTEQVRTASEVAQIATSAADLDTVLQQTVKLIIERFGYYYAAVFLLDEAKEQAILKESYSAATQNAIQQGYLSLPVSEGSIIGLVSASNQYYIAADVEKDPYYLPVSDLPDTRSEAVIPLSVGDNVIGVLDVQSHQVNAFEADSIATLQTLANQIATVLQNFNLLESARIDLRATSALYRASHIISESETRVDVLEALSKTLEQAPFISALFSVEADGLVALSVIDPIRGTESIKQLSRISISIQELAAHFENASPIMMTKDDKIENFPSSLFDLPRSMGCESFACLPIMPANQLEALLVLGALDSSRFTQIALEPYISLIDITRTALEKVNALEDIQKRLVELETISTVGQSISTETKLDTLYQIIHRQIIQVMGEVNFLIARYNSEADTIEIPYVDEGGEITSLPAFPLGQGLISIIIRTQQPLMIVEDTANRSRALGAIVTDTGFAKSWLGVPLMVANEPIGAIVVQDLENEHRFDDADMRLLVTLATQVAIAIRNARLLERSQERAEQERKLFDVTNKLRRSPDMQTILKTTAQEINAALGANRTHIRINIDPEISDAMLTSEPGEEEVTA